MFEACIWYVRGMYRAAGESCKQESVKLWKAALNVLLMKGRIACWSSASFAAAPSRVCESHSCGVARPCSLSSSIYNSTISTWRTRQTSSNHSHASSRARLQLPRSLFTESLTISCICTCMSLRMKTVVGNNLYSVLKPRWSILSIVMQARRCMRKQVSKNLIATVTQYFVQYCMHYQM